MELSPLETLSLMGLSSVAGIGLAAGDLYYLIKKDSKYTPSSEAVTVEPGPNMKPIDQNQDLKGFRKY